MPRVAATIASAVIGLPIGPTDMMTSTLLSRMAVATLFGSNWITPILPGAFGLAMSSLPRTTTLSAAMLYCRRIIFSSSTFRGERPTTPTRLPTTCSIFSIFSSGLVFAAALPFAGLAGPFADSGALGTMNTTTFLRRIAIT